MRSQKVKGYEMPGPVFEALEPRLLLSGVTLITHGFGDSVDGWVGTMQDAVADRMAARPDASSVVTADLHVTDPGLPLGDLESAFQDVSGSLDSADSGEIVLALDWSDLAGTLNPFTGLWESVETLNAPTRVAEVVADVLLQPGSLPGFSGALAQLPIHLIGHSRGGALVSELGRVLGQSGVWVDQVTTLDPHPVDDIREPVPGADLGDAAINPSENVVVWDNYWRQPYVLGVPFILGNPDVVGEPIDEAISIELSESVLSGEGYLLEHSDVHLWYHGTIDTSGSIDDGFEDVPEAAGWYVNAHPTRDSAGFNLSRTGGRQPGPAGIESRFGGSADRASVARSGAQWPNVGMVDLVGGQRVIASGATAAVEFLFDSPRPASTATVTVHLDTDRNPLNGSASSMGFVNLNQTTNVLNGQVSQAYFDVAPGDYYLSARITDGFNTRYSYLEQPITVTSVPTGSDLAIAEIAWEDDGDRDGLIEAGEQAGLDVRLSSSSAVSNVEGELITTDPLVSVIDFESDWPNISAGGSEFGDGDFDVDLSAFSSGRTTDFTLRMTYEKSGQTYVQDLGFQASFATPQDASFDIVSWSIDDSTSVSLRNNNDGVFQSGEKIRLSPVLRNLGAAPATDIDLSLDYSGGALDVETGHEGYPDLNPGEQSGPSSGETFTIRSEQRSFAGTASVDALVEWDQSISGSLLAGAIDLQVAPVGWFDPRWQDNSSRQMSFGTVSPGTTVTETLVITNVGSGPLLVDQILTSNADTTISGISAPFSIAAGASRSVDVVFDSTGLNETVQRTVTIVTDEGRATGFDDAPDSVVVQLDGTVTSSAGSNYIKRFTLSGLGNDVAAVRAGDTDGDGNRELVVLLGDFDEPELKIFERTGTDSYVERFSSGTALHGNSLREDAPNLIVQDVNGDGQDDIFFGIWSTTIGGGYATDGILYMYEGTGDNTWSNTYSGFTNKGPIGDLGFGDSDGDGRNEVIVSTVGWQTQPGAIYVLESNGGSSFSEILAINNLTQHHNGESYLDFGSPVVADTDRDGRNEILFVAGNRESGARHDYEANQLFVYESTGNNSYTKRWEGLSPDIVDIGGWEYAVLQVGDPDQDGRMEVMLAEEDNKELFIWEISGNNSWSSDITPDVYEFKATLPDDPTAMTMGDLDRDGEIEIAVTVNGHSTNPSVFGSFAADSYFLEWQGMSQLGTNADVYSIDTELIADPADPLFIVGGERPHVEVTAFGLAVSLPDLSVYDLGISLDVVDPTEGESVTIMAQINNEGLADATDVGVSFYEGDPESGGTLIDSTTVSIVYGSSKIAEADWTPSAEGAASIYVVVDEAEELVEDSEDNNKAMKSVAVEDSDTDGPAIGGIMVTESTGDGDGTIGNDETLQIEWTVTDTSGVGSVELTVDGVSQVVNDDGAGNYWSVIGPLATGPHTFQIMATDADVSLESSTEDGTFDVVDRDQVQVAFQGSPVVAGQTVSLGQFQHEGLELLPEFVITNGGDQRLDIVDLQRTAGDAFTIIDPLADHLNGPTGSLTFAVDIDQASALGMYSGTIELTTSDQVTPVFSINIEFEIVNAAPTDLTLVGASVNENEPTGTAAGTFTTTDPNAGDAFTYQLVAGTGDDDNTRFEIVGDTLRTRESFDHETEASLSIRVRTSDQHGLSHEESLAVSVLDINESPTTNSLTDGPDPVEEGATLTLTAHGVTDDSAVASMSFYRDGNDNGVGESGELLGTDTNGADGWSWSGAVSWSAGSHTYLARATDDGSPALHGPWVTTIGQVEPPAPGLTIVVGHHTIAQDHAGQTVQIFVAGGLPVAGVNFNVQITNPGGHGMVPSIVDVDILNGTIFDGNNNGALDLDGPHVDVAPQWEGRNTTTNVDTVVADGLLATITIDTTGIPVGYTYGLSLSATVNGPTSFPGTSASITDGTLETVPGAEVVDRHVFYNGSSWDTDTGASVNDDAAIATDKEALLPGESATFTNYTSYDKGLNGVMVDIQNLQGTPTLSDFEFMIGNDDLPGDWTTNRTPTSITVRPGAGTDGSDRVTIIFADNDWSTPPGEEAGSIANQWLQVKVLSDANGGSLGLAEDDVFYFGNAIGDVGDSSTDTIVNATDEIAARTNQVLRFPPFGPAPVGNIHDFNRDLGVDATDQIIARNNQTFFLTDLNLITVPGGTAPMFHAPTVASVDVPLGWYGLQPASDDVSGEDEEDPFAHGLVDLLQMIDATTL